MNNALNLQSIDQEQALNLSRFFLKSGQNIFIFGRRGTGKTHIAIEAALECGYKISYINLSVVERPDIAGYPIINDSDIVHYKSPYFLPSLQENKKPDCVLLFDEVDKCPQEVTAPLLEILDTHSINGKKLNVIACILTGNLANEGAFSNELNKALLDRGAKYILKFNFEKWLTWARAHGVHDLILGFLVSNPEYACGEIESSCYATPSPRGWTHASEALIKARTAKIVDIDTIVSIVSGFVGFEAGLKFRTWYNYYRGFEPIIASLIETGSCIINYNELTPTEKMVFCIAACHLTKIRFIQESKTKPQYQYVERLCNFLLTNNVALEIQAIGIANSFPAELVVNPKYKLYQCKSFFDLSSKVSLPSFKK